MASCSQLRKQFWVLKAKEKAFFSFKTYLLLANSKKCRNTVYLIRKESNLIILVSQYSFKTLPFIYKVGY